MNVWMHKETGELSLVTPLYQKYVKGDKVDEPLVNLTDFTIHLEDDSSSIFAKAGLGFLNSYGCVFLFPDKPALREQFEDLGEL